MARFFSIFFMWFSVCVVQAGNYVDSIAFLSGSGSLSQYVKSDNSLKMILRFGTSGMDETRVEFNKEATIGFDDIYDANKPGSSPGVPTLYTHLNTNLWYGINTLPPLTTVTTVPMGLRPDMNTTMTLTPEGIQTFDPTTYLFLEDKKVNVWKNLRSGTYTFTTVTTDNQNRFVLHFTPPAVITTVNASCKAPGSISIQQPGSANWNYSILDSNNLTVQSGALNVNSPVSVNVGPGVYQLLLSDQTGYTVMKNILVEGYSLPNAIFTNDTSTAEVGQPITFTPYVSGYSSYHWNFGDDSSAQSYITQHSYDSTGSYTVQLTVTDSAGCQSSFSSNVTIVSKQITSLISPRSQPAKVWTEGGNLVIQFADATEQDVEVEVYSILVVSLFRDRLRSAGLFKHEMPVSAAGYYVVRLQSINYSLSTRVFISKP